MEPAAHHRFAALVEPHLAAVRGYVARRDPALADDVIQEVSVVAWRRLEELPMGDERAWLFGVARNVLLTERRKARRHDARRTVDPDVLETIAADDDPGLAPAVAGPLAQALRRLSARDRELLLLTAWEGLSTAEVASVVGIRGTAARMGLVRARRRLAAALDDLDPGWGGAASRGADPEPATATGRSAAVTGPSDDHRDHEEVTSCHAART
ncbi:MAG: sigma-70 family RNA polymerase sigma factor [Patulibacter sp.]|nr:sigma-70 family RNA polymerase sigma factor [Patulibacter sp.]